MTNRKLKITKDPGEQRTENILNVGFFSGAFLNLFVIKLREMNER